MPTRLYDHDEEDDPYLVDHDEEEELATCRECGHSFYADAEMCPSCGHYITDEEGSKQTSLPKWVRVTAVVLLLALLLPVLIDMLRS